MSQQQISFFAAASTAFGPLDQIVENRYTTPEVQDYFYDRAGLWGKTAVKFNFLIKMIN
jgi:hypothetical protein